MSCHTTYFPRLRATPPQDRENDASSAVVTTEAKTLDERPTSADSVGTQGNSICSISGSGGEGAGSEKSNQDKADMVAAPAPAKTDGGRGISSSASRSKGVASLDNRERRSDANLQAQPKEQLPHTNVLDADVGKDGECLPGVDSARDTAAGDGRVAGDGAGDTPIFPGAKMTTNEIANLLLSRTRLDYETLFLEIIAKELEKDLEKSAQKEDASSVDVSNSAGGGGGGEQSSRRTEEAGNLSLMKYADTVGEKLPERSKMPAEVSAKASGTPSTAKASNAETSSATVSSGRPAEIYSGVRKRSTATTTAQQFPAPNGPRQQHLQQACSFPPMDGEDMGAGFDETFGVGERSSSSSSSSDEDSSLPLERNTSLTRNDKEKISSGVEKPSSSKKYASSAAAGAGDPAPPRSSSGGPLDRQNKAGGGVSKKRRLVGLPETGEGEDVFSPAVLDGGGVSSQDIEPSAIKGGATSVAAAAGGVVGGSVHPPAKRLKVKRSSYDEERGDNAGGGGERSRGSSNVGGEMESE